MRAVSEDEWPSFDIPPVCVVTSLAMQVPPVQLPQYPFQNPDLPIEQRIDNILSLMTIDEKIECLDTNPRFLDSGIKGSGHVEGIHGLTQGGPGKWGRPLTIRRRRFHRGSDSVKRGTEIC